MNRFDWHCLSLENGPTEVQSGERKPQSTQRERLTKIPPLIAPSCLSPASSRLRKATMEAISFAAIEAVTEFRSPEWHDARRLAS